MPLFLILVNVKDLALFHDHKMENFVVICSLNFCYTAHISLFLPLFLPIYLSIYQYPI